MQEFLGKLRFDRYLIMLICSVALAALLPVRGSVASALDFVVIIAIALLFFLYGARLSPKAIGQGLFHWRLQLLILASTYVLFPLIGLGIVLVSDGKMAGELLTGFLFLCLLPSTVQSSIAFTSIARGNVAAALTSASVSNLIGVFITPMLVTLLLTSSGGGSSIKALADLSMQILLPFGIGQLSRPLISQTLHRHNRLRLAVDRGSILLVVYAAFSKGMVAGIWSETAISDLMFVAILLIVLLIAMLFLTSSISRLLSFDEADRIAIIFCGSKKSMATGIPLAGAMFTGHSLPLIILPLMIFHQIQLFACATLAQKYAARPMPFSVSPVETVDD